MRVIAKQRSELARATYCRFVADIPQEMFLFIDETAKDKKKLQVSAILCICATFGERYGLFFPPPRPDLARDGPGGGGGSALGLTFFVKLKFTFCSLTLYLLFLFLF